MEITVDGRTYAHPAEQARLGADLEERVGLLADHVERLHASDVEDKELRALAVANCAMHQLSFLGRRKEEIGQLSPAVAKELTTAETVILKLNTLARMSMSEEEEHALPIEDEEWNTFVPRMPRKEYIPAMMRLAKFLRRRFPGNTAERWEMIARSAIETDLLQARTAH